MATPMEIHIARAEKLLNIDGGLFSRQDPYVALELRAGAMDGQALWLIVNCMEKNRGRDGFIGRAYLNLSQLPTGRPCPGSLNLANGTKRAGTIYYTVTRHAPGAGGGRPPASAPGAAPVPASAAGGYPGSAPQAAGGYPGGPGARPAGGYPGAPPTGGYPGGPGTPPAGGYPGAPPAGGYPGSAPQAAGGYPVGPGARPAGGYPGSAPQAAGGYPVGPGARPAGGYPGSAPQAAGGYPGGPGTPPAGGYPGAPPAGGYPGGPGAPPAGGAGSMPGAGMPGAGMPAPGMPGGAPAAALPPTDKSAVSGAGTLMAGRPVIIRGIGTNALLAGPVTDRQDLASCSPTIDESSTWIPIPNKTLKLQSVANPRLFLSVVNGQLVGAPDSAAAEWGFGEREGPKVHLQAIASLGARNMYAGFLPSGAMKPPCMTGNGPCGSFTAEFLDRRGARHEARSGLPWNHIKPGSVVLLKNQATDRYMRMNPANGALDALGDASQMSQFWVHTTRSAKFALLSSDKLQYRKFLQLAGSSRLRLDTIPGSHDTKCFDLVREGTTNQFGLRALTSHSVSMPDTGEEMFYIQPAQN